MLNLNTLTQHGERERETGKKIEREKQANQTPLAEEIEELEADGEVRQEGGVALVGGAEYTHGR